MVLSRYLPPSKLCTALKEHGVSKHSVTEIQRNLKDGLEGSVTNNIFVFRTDIKSYYESINHKILLNKLSVYIKNKMVMNLLSPYSTRSIK